MAVIAGDIHFNLNTMHIANAGTKQAIAKANELNVPFISNGDMLDTKANLRAEYVNMLIETFKLCNKKPYVNVGNHSRCNEKSPEHALHFLKPYAHIIETPTYVDEIASTIIPYDHDPDALRTYLKTLKEGSRLIMHQGVNKALAGEYIQDKSAIDKEDLADFRTILSHYHARQDIKCGRPRKAVVGLASYIGNLYTLNFSEASDLPKGFQILMSDGTLEFVPTNLRKHVVIDAKITHQAITVDKPYYVSNGDLVKVKLTGTKECLTISKDNVKTMLSIPGDFKLELIPLETSVKTTVETKGLCQNAILDSIIDSVSNVSIEQKNRLKLLWKSML